MDGIALGDELVSVIELAAGYADRTAQSSIHSAGHVRCTVDTAGDRLLVTWRSPVYVFGVAEVAGVAGDVGEALIAPGII